ncbi:MAG: glycine cleavage system protein GcvH [Deltaproteobacteria bacterium]|nr:glycine cleavage system protein GcvH [Deltaproteobacteria bacterium]
MRVREWEFPDELFYDEHHQWVRFEGGTARVGLTDFGQDTRGDILYVQLPVVGTSVRAGSSVASIETGKWVGRLYTPCDGTVAAVNSALEGEPGRMNADPYGEGWIFEIEMQPGSLRPALLQGQELRAWVEDEAARYAVEEAATEPSGPYGNDG